MINTCPWVPELQPVQGSVPLSPRHPPPVRLPGVWLSREVAVKPEAQPNLAVWCPAPGPQQ